MAATEDQLDALKSLFSGSSNVGMLGVTPEMLQYGQQQADQANALAYDRSPDMGFGYAGYMAGSGIKHALDDMSGYESPAVKQSKLMNNIWNASGQLVDGSSEGQQFAQQSNGSSLTATSDGMAHRAEVFALMAQKAGLPPTAYLPVLKQFNDTSKSINDQIASKRKAYGIGDVDPNKSIGVNQYIASQNAGANGGLGNFDLVQDRPQGELINLQNQRSLLLQQPQTPDVAAQIAEIDRRITVGNQGNHENNMDEIIRRVQNGTATPADYSVLRNNVEQTQKPVARSDGGIFIPPSSIGKQVGAANQTVPTQLGDPADPHNTLPTIQNGGINYPGSAGAKYTNEQVEKMAQAKTSIASMQSAIQSWTGLLNKYKDVKDIPGFTLKDSWLANNMPQMLSEEGKQNRMTWQAVQNAKMLDASGRTVTLGEMAPQLMELGSGTGMGGDAIRLGTANLLKNFSAKSRTIDSGFDDPTRKEYYRRYSGGKQSSPSSSSSPNSGGSSGGRLVYKNGRLSYVQ